MIPLIIAGGDTNNRALYITKEYPKGKWVVTHVVAAKTKILIAQIHDVLKALTTTSPLPRLIWIEDADLMTIPAQNSLLKILEEPPRDTQFILSTASASSLLATIRSRCRIVPLSAEQSPDNTDLTLLRSALSMAPGDRIIAADSLGKKREEVIVWCTGCLQALRVKALGDTSPKSLRITTAIGILLEQSVRDLQANVSVGLVMQNLFLKLPRIIGQ